MLDGNSLLGALNRQDAELVAPMMRTLELRTGHVLYEAGDQVTHTYFPRRGAVANAVIALAEGPVVETAIVGHEGALGGLVSRGRIRSFARAAVLHGGSFYRIATVDLERAKEQSAPLRMLFARYADCLLAQVYQTVACNAAHSLDQRLARWIMATVERTGAARIPGTQEDLAQMLGVGRSYASRVIQRFKQQGALRTRRGAIEVVDLDVIRAYACSCNDVINAHFRAVLGELYRQ